jgi:hypothetical protein
MARHSMLSTNREPLTIPEHNPSPLIASTSTITGQGQPLVASPSSSPEKGLESPRHDRATLTARWEPPIKPPLTTLDDASQSTNDEATSMGSLNESHSTSHSRNAQHDYERTYTSGTGGGDHEQPFRDRSTERRRSSFTAMGNLRDHERYDGHDIDRDRRIQSTNIRSSSLDRHGESFAPNARNGTNKSHQRDTSLSSTRTSGSQRPLQCQGVESGNVIVQMSPECPTPGNIAILSALLEPDGQDLRWRCHLFSSQSAMRQWSIYWDGFATGIPFGSLNTIPSVAGHLLELRRSQTRVSQ